MALTLPTLQTYGDMLKTLRVRCGQHATVGQASALEDILTEAHEYVYGEMDDGYPVTSTLTLAANTNTYPSISDGSVPIARGSIKTLWIERGSQERHELPQGINHAMRAYVDLRSIPEAWDSQYRGADDAVWTLEVWPTPDQAYPLYIDHQRVLTRFSDPADYPSVDYRLVLGYAIAMGKAHYGKPDANTVGEAFKKTLYTAKALQKENRRFLPPTAYTYAGPRVVATANGFVQIGGHP